MQDSASTTVKQKKTLNDVWLSRVLRNRLSQLAAQEVSSVNRPPTLSVSPASSASTSSGEVSPALEGTSTAGKSSMESKPSEDVDAEKPASSASALSGESSRALEGTCNAEKCPVASKASEDVDAEKPGSSQSALEPEEPSDDGRATTEIKPVPPAINLETEKGDERSVTVSSETNVAAGGEREVVQPEEMGQSTSSPIVAPEDAAPPAEATQPANHEIVDVSKRPVEVIEYHDGPQTRLRSRMAVARLERNRVPPAPQDNEAGRQLEGQEPIQEPARYQIVLGDVTRWFAESGRRILESGWKSFEPPSHILNQDELLKERLEERLEEVQEEDNGPEQDVEEHQELQQPELRRSQRKRRKRTLSLPIEEPKRQNRK